jgi:tellurite resistance protein TerC
MKEAKLMPDGTVNLGVNPPWWIGGSQNPGTVNLLGEDMHRRHRAGNINITKDVADVEEDLVMLWDATQNQWVSLFMIVLVLMCLDGLIAKKLPKGSFLVHIGMLLGWIFCGLGTSAFYFVEYGPNLGMYWLVGYALEWMLSFDNLFAFQLLFRTYCVPSDVQEKAVFWGVIISIASRAVLFCCLSYVASVIIYFQPVLGMFLVYMGIKALQDDVAESDNVADLVVVRMLKNLLGSRLKESWEPENNGFFLRDEEGKLCVTLLMPLTIGVIVFDFIFAIDSVTAKVAQIPNQYIAYSSSVLAMLGLRAMFFVLDDMVKYFELLRYGVAFVLVFIGAELTCASRFHVPNFVVLAVIMFIIAVCILGSVFKETFISLWNRRSEMSALTFYSRKATTSSAAKPMGDAKLMGDSESNAKPTDGRSEELHKKLEKRLEVTEGASIEASAVQHKEAIMETSEGSSSSSSSVAA